MTSIESNARWIADRVRRESGDPLANFVCCVEADFMRAGRGCDMEFSTARAYAARKGMIFGQGPRMPIPVPFFFGPDGVLP